MDYSDDSCMTEFTPGQTVAMIASYIKLRAVPGSIIEVEDNDEGSTPASSTSDNLSQQSETTVSNNVDDGGEPSEGEVDSSAPENSNDGGFSTMFGFSQSAPSGNTGTSGFFSPQMNAGTSAPQSSSFGSFGGFGSFGSGDGGGESGGGGGGQELVPSGFDYVAPTAGMFTPSSTTVDAAPSPVAANSQECGSSLKVKGELCSSNLQCCSGVCAGIFFFDKCA
jgi:hypothetical protein